MTKYRKVYLEMYANHKLLNSCVFNISAVTVLDVTTNTSYLDFMGNLVCAVIFSKLKFYLKEEELKKNLHLIIKYIYCVDD